MARVIAHSGDALDHNRYSWQCPQIRSEAMRLRTLPQRLVDLPQVSGVQLRFAAGTACATQGCGATAPPFRIPTAHALAARLQFPRDFCQHHLARSKQTARLLPPLFQALKIPSWRNMGLHAAILSHRPSLVTVLCETQ
jgi:hypothetical protein